MSGIHFLYIGIVSYTTTLDAAETVLGFFGFNRTAYSNFKRNNNGRRRKWRWYEELREHRVRDIEAEML
jgi:hypothetical protein